MEENRNTESVVEVIDATETKLGYVTECLLLNVRELPSTESKVLCVIECLTELLIDETFEHDEFFKVYLDTGLEGYCMKKFIAIAE